MDGISSELKGAAVDVAVLKKQKEMIQQQGQAAVELIQSADAAQPPAKVASPPGLGSMIDVYI